MSIAQTFVNLRNDVLFVSKRPGPNRRPSLSDDPSLPSSGLPMDDNLSNLKAEVSLIQAQLAALRATKEEASNGRKVCGVFWDMGKRPLTS
jgi:hypothetical protein